MKRCLFTLVLFACGDDESTVPDASPDTLTACLTCADLSMLLAGGMCQTGGGGMPEVCPETQPTFNCLMAKCIDVCFSQTDTCDAGMPTMPSACESCLSQNCATELAQCQ
jgi:hypothetical protein